MMVVGGNALERAGIQHILEASGEIVVHAACNQEEAVEHALGCLPDIALLTERACPESGAGLVSRLRSLPRPPQVVLLVEPDDDRTLEASVGAGAAGVLRNDLAPQDLISAMRLIFRGNQVLPRTVTALRVDRVPQDEATREAADRLHSLTAREREVLARLAGGLTNHEISRCLMLSTATVKDHVSAIYAKLHQSNRVQVALMAHRLGFLPQDDVAARRGSLPVQRGSAPPRVREPLAVHAPHHRAA
ncbi:response regulator transcription factor [Streptomyces cyaneofuscatus]|uniref:response regulator transcription factor n=1 Tax=Streptomyces cyaneofuscatus TaxID=66883 RepID=UPI00343A142B